MILQRLSIDNFKNIAQVRLEFSPKANCLLGNNGMGKSNLLDAIYYLSFCKSFNGVNDAMLIKRDEDFCIVNASYLRRNAEDELVLGMSRNKRKSLKRKGKEYQRLSQHIGLFPLVIIAPNDIDLIRGNSDERRRFIDMIISQSDHNYLDQLIRYNKSLDQRNKLLRDGAADHGLYLAVEITMSMAAIKRVAEVLNEESDINNPEHPIYEVPNGSVDFNHVNFAYKKDSEEFVLKDIDLHIKSGETIGVMGGTGSAKTSLVNLISRLYDVTEGEVCVGGINVKDYDMESLRNQVSVVLQNNVLFSGTILENLRWGNKDATYEECVRACELACADEFIQKFPDKYDTHIEQGGTNVSGGQKQRLCIARALLKNPKILILDDSTSAVDTATDAKIRKAFAVYSSFLHLYYLILLK